jgi:formylmethanofuran dehydrogenase subunit C
MSATVTLSLRAPLDGVLEVEGVTGDRFAALAEREIAALPVVMRSRAATLGDFFDVRGERSADVRIEGDLSRVHRLAAGMTGGRVHVVGNAGDEAGLAMTGGVLRIDGNAGDRLGAAFPGASKGMSGGEIIVSGSAGAEAATRARRGMVVVSGDAGVDAARAMVAGTLVVFGRIGARPGRGSKRGSIVALGGIDVPETYWLACTYQPPYVRLLLTYLRRQHGLKIDDRHLEGRYRRHCGDAGNPGRGEILEWTDVGTVAGAIAG